MTEITSPDVSLVAARAAQVRFWPLVRRVPVTFLLLLFAGIGFVAGTLWFGLVFTYLWCAEATAMGFRKGSNLRRPSQPQTPSLPV